jgi:hypothetical protein
VRIYPPAHRLALRHVPSHELDHGPVKLEPACLSVLFMERATESNPHPSTLAARYELAFWSGESGDAAGARDQYAALLPIRERVLGAEHPSTMTTPRQPRFLDRAGGGCC